MSDLKITGQITEFLPVESGTTKAGKEWKKQNFLVQNFEGHEGREQIFCFEVFGGENVEQLSKYNTVGDDVVVHFNIQTNEWKDKYYTSLRSWRIQKVEAILKESEPKEIPVDTIDDGLPF